MPLSSVVGAQSIIRPGVCTSSTRPASPYDGQVIYETDTDKTLVWNGTGWVFLSTSRANPGGLDLVKTQTIGSAVSSVTVSDVFSSNYESYLVQLTGGVASTTPVELRLTLGSTSTGYNYAGIYNIFNSSGPQGLSSTTATYFGFAGFGSTNTNHAQFHLFNPFEAKYTVYRSSWTSFGSSESQGTISGFLTNTTSYTAFTLTCSTGTLTGGTIRVYGYVNS